MPSDNSTDPNDVIGYTAEDPTAGESEGDDADEQDTPSREFTEGRLYEAEQQAAASDAESTPDQPDDPTAASEDQATDDGAAADSGSPEQETVLKDEYTRETGRTPPGEQSGEDSSDGSDIDYGSVSDAARGDLDGDGKTIFDDRKERMALLTGLWAGFWAAAPSKKVRKFFWKIADYEPKDGEYSIPSVMDDAKDNNEYAGTGVVVGVVIGSLLELSILVGFFDDNPGALSFLNHFVFHHVETMIRTILYGAGAVA